jgi:Domain of unknown function (DUF4349)
MKKTFFFIAICLAVGCQKAKNKSESNATAENKVVTYDMEQAPPPPPPPPPASNATMNKMVMRDANESGNITLSANRATSAVSDTVQLDAAPVKHIVFPTSTYSTPLRKIVRTAQIKSKVDNTEQATYKIEQITRKFNGFVTQTHLESRNLNQSETPISKDSTLETSQFEVGNKITLRVPNQHLDTFLVEMSRLYTHLDFRQVNAQDLTATFLTNQLKAQLRDNSAKRIAQASDEKGKRLSDITDAEEVRVNMKDAAIEQQIQNLETDYDIAFSVVNLDIYQNAVVSKTMKVNVSSLNASANFGFRLTTALANGWSILMEIFLFVVSLWGFMLIGFAAVWGFKKVKSLNYFPAKS